MISGHADQQSWTRYPASCFDASSTYNAWVKLTAADLHALRYERGFEGQHLYFHLNHPIRFVQLVGVVTSVSEVHPRLGVVTIDDGSGAMLNVKINRLASEIAESFDCPSNTDVDSVNIIASIGIYKVVVDGQELEPGRVIKVKGVISVFRDLRQLELKRIVVVRTTNEEATFWSQLARYKNDVLARPWVLDEATRSKYEARRMEMRKTEVTQTRETRAKWVIWKEKMKVRENKIEQQRRKQEVMFNAGALPGSNVLTMPWNTHD